MRDEEARKHEADVLDLVYTHSESQIRQRVTLTPSHAITITQKETIMTHRRPPSSVRRLTSFTRQQSWTGADPCKRDAQCTAYARRTTLPNLV